MNSFFSIKFGNSEKKYWTLYDEFLFGCKALISLKSNSSNKIFKICLSNSNPKISLN